MDVLGLFGMGPGFMMMAIVVLACAIFWIVQFMILMGMSDAAFPGRHDKLIWGLAMVFLTLLGALAFREWRYAMDRKRRAEEMERVRRQVRVVG